MGASSRGQGGCTSFDALPGPQACAPAQGQAEAEGPAPASPTTAALLALGLSDGTMGVFAWRVVVPQGQGQAKPVPVTAGWTVVWATQQPGAAPAHLACALQATPAPAGLRHPDSGAASSGSSSLLLACAQAGRGAVTVLSLPSSSDAPARSAHLHPGAAAAGGVSCLRWLPDPGARGKGQATTDGSGTPSDSTTTSTLAVAGAEGPVELWRVHWGAEQGGPPDDGGAAQACAGEAAAAGAQGPAVELVGTLRGHTDQVLDVGVCPDLGPALAACMQPHASAAGIGHAQGVAAQGSGQQLEVTPPTWLVTASRDQTVRGWALDIPTLQAQTRLAKQQQEQEARLRAEAAAAAAAAAAQAEAEAAVAAAAEAEQAAAEAAAAAAAQQGAQEADGSGTAAGTTVAKAAEVEAARQRALAAVAALLGQAPPAPAPAAPAPAPAISTPGQAPAAAPQQLPAILASAPAKSEVTGVPPGGPRGQQKKPLGALLAAKPVLPPAPDFAKPEVRRAARAAVRALAQALGGSSGDGSSGAESGAAAAAAAAGAAPPSTVPSGQQAEAAAEAESAAEEAADAEALRMLAQLSGDLGAMQAAGVVSGAPERQLLAHMWRGDVRAALQVGCGGGRGRPGLRVCGGRSAAACLPCALLTCQTQARRQEGFLRACMLHPVCSAQPHAVPLLIPPPAQVAVPAGLLSADLVACAASLGGAAWRAAARLYAAQQEAAGQAHVAVMHLLAIGDRGAASAVYR